MKAKQESDLYKIARNEVTSKIRQAKKAHFANKLEECNGNSKKMYKAINELKGKSHNTLPNSLNTSDGNLSNERDIANAFGSYFAKIAQNLVLEAAWLNMESYKPGPEFKSFVKDRLSPKVKYDIPLITSIEVTKYLKSIDVKKSTGLDGISPHFLMLASNELSTVICDIINSSILEGVYPTSWKLAKVLPLYKSGCKSELNNYRPISVLSCVSKVMERHVHCSFYKFLQDNELICVEQSGFRPKHSCQTCLTSLLNSCICDINDGRLIGLITIDLRKAFDLLDLDVLLSKLIIYGCSTDAIKWFSSYLNGRSQKVLFRNVYSKVNNVGYGVPQGSILGPLLFALYINDLPLCISNVDFTLYADDSTLRTSSMKVEELQNTLNAALEKLCKWCDNNRLIINVKKTNYMIICSRQKRSSLVNDKLELSVNNEKIERKETIKLLGMYIDENLTWKPQIDHVCSKLSSLNGVLYRQSFYMDYNMKNVFYNSFILSHIDYCINIWGNASTTYLNKIQILQNRAARTILNADRFVSSHVLLERLKWMSVAQRSDYITYLLIFKVLHGLAANYLNVFIPAENHYALRESSASTFKVPHPRNELMKQSFSYNAPLMWNNLSCALRNCDNIHTFKQILKRRILSST